MWNLHESYQFLFELGRTETHSYDYVVTADGDVCLSYPQHKKTSPTQDIIKEKFVPEEEEEVLPGPDR